MRVDYDGQSHNGTKTPHLHVCYSDDATELKFVDGYSTREDILGSFKAFLEYNNYDISELKISNQLAMDIK